LKTPDLGINRFREYTLTSERDRVKERKRETWRKVARERTGHGDIYEDTGRGEKGRGEERQNGSGKKIKNASMMMRTFRKNLAAACTRYVCVYARAHSAMCRSEFSRMTSDKAATRAHLILLC